MNAEALTRDRILDTAEDVLRRFGPAKTTVVDVARALGVSHGTIYRHFPSKAALRDAVAQRWLARVAHPLGAIAAEHGPATDRLYRWLTGLAAAKRHKVLDDPELFATYHGLAEQARGVVDAHVEELTGQIARIIDDGISEGAFVVSDVTATARAVFDATLRFHHPAHSREWNDPDIDDAFEAVWGMLLAALTGRQAGAA
ncbi:TetR family transcriptional regulator [Arhodomonas sp. AD133]|uniref:TetR family transcriptional regulator n=1 Tax=Arhodomonas sp. AD133 TaxID=3415009 RepID=UPI003EBE3FC8